MSVQELIDILTEVSDKTLEIEVNDQCGGSYVLNEVFFYKHNSKDDYRVYRTTAQEAEYVELE